MDIRQLTYFVAAVEEKTITAAAEKLHMTQPPLTMQLHMLEDELGCKLFRRDGRTLSLTDAGQHFYSRALEIIGMCDSAKSEMNDYRSGNAGELRIGAISSVRGTLFTDWIKDYHDKFENEYFQLIGKQGLFEYYAYIPESSDPLKITNDELSTMFSFVNL